MSVCVVVVGAGWGLGGGVNTDALRKQERQSVQSKRPQDKQPERQEEEE